MLYHNMDSNCMQNSNGHAVCCSFQDEVYAGYVYMLMLIASLKVKWRFRCTNTFLSINYKMIRISDGYDVKCLICLNCYGPNKYILLAFSSIHHICCPHILHHISFEHYP